MKTFWANGYAGTSFSLLESAMNMNNPSIYLAFGGKESLFLKAVDFYSQKQHTAIMSALNSDESYSARLEKFAVASVKNACNKRHPGCLLITVLADATSFSPKFKIKLKEFVDESDAAIVTFIRQGIEAGELRPCADPDLLGKVFMTALSGLALRARGGESEASLMSIARETVKTLFA